MNVVLMSGAFINAGDYLIETRCKCLLEHNLKDSKITIFRRDLNYDNDIEKLNSFDLIVFGGGPGYKENYYSKYMPFVSDLNKIKVPIMILGWGMSGNNIFDVSGLYEGGFFSESMKRLLNHASKNELYIGCRDWNTYQLLKKQGYTNALMTGCPAWFDLERIDNLKVNRNLLRKEKIKIAVSEPAKKWNAVYIETVLKTVREYYHNAEIFFVTHRLTKESKKYVIQNNILKKYNITHYDITGTVDGFKIYDSCDLHVGFRVHAHIYNLSRGNVSILLEEDIRGISADQALGVASIDISMTRLERYINYIISKVKAQKKLSYMIINQLDYINNSECSMYDTVCENIKKSYAGMLKQLSKVSEIIG